MKRAAADNWPADSTACSDDDDSEEESDHPGCESVEPLTRAEILDGSKHRDGSIYAGAEFWHRIYHVADARETRVEPMMLSEPTADCRPTAWACESHHDGRMMQIFSLKLAAAAVLDDGPVQLYGFLAVRDLLNPLRNYVFNRGRDDPFVVAAGGAAGSLIQMAGPKRGIQMSARVLMEFDMRIKRGEREEDDLELVDGAITFSELISFHCRPYTRRIHGDHGALDVSVALIGSAVEATIQVEPRDLGRFVVAVVKGSALIVFLDVGQRGGTDRARPCYAFKARKHGSCGAPRMASASPAYSWSFWYLVLVINALLGCSLEMDRVKRFAGMAKSAPAVPVRKDEDESLVLFGELYKNEKEKEVNLLEPMFSVEFEAIQGDGRMFKLPSGKRDYFLPDGEKHDYDWLKTPPATPLFPSLEMEANSTQMIYQKELPILQPVRTSRFSSKSDATSTSTRSESPTSSSSKSVTPTARPGSSSKKNLDRDAPALPKEKDSAYRIDKRSSYTPLTNRQHNAIPAARKASTATKESKTTSAKKPAGPSSTNAVRNVAKPDKALKDIVANTTKARSKDSSVGAKDQKAEVGTARRVSCPPAAAMGSNGELQDTVATKVRSRTGTGSAPATRKGIAAATEAIPNGRRRVGGEKEQRPKTGSHAKK
ncbi:hypothetical protein ACP70R_044965 [Stipagrostis hirtigluma subsp. patula]